MDHTSVEEAQVETEFPDVCSSHNHIPGNTPQDITSLPTTLSNCQVLLAKINSNMWQGDRGQLKSSLGFHELSLSNRAVCNSSPSVEIGMVLG